MSGDPLQLDILASAIYPVPPDQRVAVGETLIFEVREADGEVLGLVQGIMHRFAIDDRLFWGELSYDWLAPTHPDLLGQSGVYACALTVLSDDETLPTLSPPGAPPVAMSATRSKRGPYRPSEHRG